MTEAGTLFQDSEFSCNEFLFYISFTQLVIGSDYNYYFKESRLDQNFGRRNEFRENQRPLAVLNKLHPAG